MEERCENKRLDPECLETDGPASWNGALKSRLESRAWPRRGRGRFLGYLGFFFFFFSHDQTPENSRKYHPIFYLALDFRQLKFSFSIVLDVCDSSLESS